MKHNCCLKANIFYVIECIYFTSSKVSVVNPCILRVLYTVFIFICICLLYLLNLHGAKFVRISVCYVRISIVVVCGFFSCQIQRTSK